MIEGVALALPLTRLEVTGGEKVSMELRRDDREHKWDMRSMLAWCRAYPATDGRGLSGVA